MTYFFIAIALLGLAIPSIAGWLLIAITLPMMIGYLLGMFISKLAFR